MVKMANEMKDENNGEDERKGKTKRGTAPAMDKLLQRLYTNPSSPACYTGVERLWLEARKYRPAIQRHQVEEFLAGQDVYTRYRRVVRRFRRLPTLAAGLHTHWQADLAEMGHLAAENDGMEYMLVCVDVLSRQLFVQPLRKKTAEEMVRAFECVFRRAGTIPWVLVTDQGREFTAGHVQDYFRRLELRHYCNFTSPKWHAGMAERANRTVKERLYRYFAQKKTSNWVSVIQRLVGAINHTPHSALNGLRPVDITFANAHRVRQWLQQQVEAVQAKHPAMGRSKFRVGDRVRVERYKHVFQKGYHPNFSNEVFVVDQVRKARRFLPITYRLRNRNGDVLRGWFYANDLCRVRLSPNKEAEESRGQLARDRDGQPVYAIERVLRRRGRKNGDKTSGDCLVRWRGYGPEHDSWIPASTIIKL